MEEEYLGQKMLERLIGHEVPEICVPIALMVFSHVIRENSTSADIMDEVNFFKSSILYRANPNSLSQRAEAYLASLKSQIRSEFINESEITDPAEAAFRTAEGITVREERDRILKESYLKQASELGLGKASCLYSEILFRDQAKKENADLAVYYATKAVSQGYWHGYRQLAAIQHYLGSPEEEKRFLTLGAEKNDGSCLDRLGRILDNQEDTSSQIAKQSIISKRPRRSLT
jgi:TPR repeat protein